MSDAADAVAAMDAIYGLAWSDQYSEERRYDGASSQLRGFGNFYFEHYTNF